MEPVVSSGGSSRAGGSARGARGGRGETARAIEDAGLVEALREEGADGPGWREVRMTLAELAVGTLQRLVHTGDLNSKMQRLTGSSFEHLSQSELETLRRDLVTRDRLVYETVYSEIAGFYEHAIRDQRWVAGRGASLSTYFVNRCVLAFANSIRRWRREESSREVSTEYLTGENDLDSLLRRNVPARSEDPLDSVLAEESAVALLRSMGPELASAAVIKAHTGLTWTEVADRLGVTRKSIERRLAKFRVERQKLPANTAQMMASFAMEAKSLAERSEDEYEKYYQPLMHFFERDSEQFVQQLAGEVLPVGGWSVVGAYLFIFDAVPSQSEHPLVLEMIKLGTRYQLSRGYSEKDLTGYERYFLGKH